MPVKDGGVIRLDVPNVAELAETKASPFISVGGLKWRLLVRCGQNAAGVKYLAVAMHCKTAGECRTNWNCEATLRCSLLSTKQRSISKVQNHTFEGEANWGFPEFMPWRVVLQPERGFIRRGDGGISVIAAVAVNNVVGILSTPLRDFTKPQQSTDVALIVEDKRLHVEKLYLAMYSPYFHALFFGDFAEKDKKEIPLPEVAFDDFVELLHVVYPSHQPVTDANVTALLNLGDRFNFEFVIRACNAFLCGPESEKIGIEKKLAWADRYGLDGLRFVVLQGITTFGELKALQSTSEYGELSDKTKAALLDRVPLLIPI